MYKHEEQFRLSSFITENWVNHFVCRNEDGTVDWNKLKIAINSKKVCDFLETKNLSYSDIKSDSDANCLVYNEIYENQRNNINRKVNEENLFLLPTHVIRAWQEHLSDFNNDVGCICIEHYLMYPEEWNVADSKESEQLEQLMKRQVGMIADYLVTNGNYYAFMKYCEWLFPDSVLFSMLLDYIRKDISYENSGKDIYRWLHIALSSNSTMYPEELVNCILTAQPKKLFGKGFDYYPICEKLVALAKKMREENPTDDFGVKVYRSIKGFKSSKLVAELIQREYVDDIDSVGGNSPIQRPVFKYELDDNRCSKKVNSSVNKPCTNATQMKQTDDHVVTIPKQKANEGKNSRDDVNPKETKKEGQNSSKIQSEVMLDENETKPRQSFSIADEILKFKHLLEIGAITQSEFDEAKKQLLLKL